MVNQLYPTFFRLDRLALLIVGAGAVGEEKLRFILKSSPDARVTVVAPWMGEALRELLEKKGARTQVRADEQTAWELPEGGRIGYKARPFEPDDAEAADLIVAATDITEVNRAVHTAAKRYRRLCNIADTPELCDFYLGSIVTRGPLKLAISTNGQSPTFAKRMRQWLESQLPESETTDLIHQLNAVRDRLDDDFATKVRELNLLTHRLLASGAEASRTGCSADQCLLRRFTSAAGGGTAKQEL